MNKKVFSLIVDGEVYYTYPNFSFNVTSLNYCTATAFPKKIAREICKDILDKNPRTQARKDPQIYKIENKYNDLEQKIERLETHGWENNTVANSEKDIKR